MLEEGQGMSEMQAKTDGVVKRALDKAKQNIFDIEKREDLSDDEKVTRIIKIFGATCAGVAVQPIPFADIFVLTPIQAYMGSRIAAIREVPVSESEATQTVKEIASVIGMGLLAQQLVIGGYKTFIPFLGGFTTIPIVFGLTYAMGKVMDEYFKKKAKKEKIDAVILKQIWVEALKIGKQEGKANKNSIIVDSKQLSPEKAE
jgi:uncharacterized protein (DUF697 family)